MSFDASEWELNSDICNRKWVQAPSLGVTLGKRLSWRVGEGRQAVRLRKSRAGRALLRYEALVRLQLQRFQK